MAQTLNKEDKIWIQKGIDALEPKIGSAITLAVTRFKPTRLLNVGIVTVAIAMGDASLHQHISDRLSAIETELVSLRALIASSNPTSPRNQAAAREIIARASGKAIPDIPESTVKQIGPAYLRLTGAVPDIDGYFIQRIVQAEKGA